MQSTKNIKTVLSFLIIEKDAVFWHQMQNNLPHEFGDGSIILQAEDEKQTIAILRDQQFDIVLADIKSLCGDSPLIEKSISKICRLAEKSLVIAISNGRSVSLAVDAMRAGAHDFIAKPLDTKTFATRIAELGQRHGHAKTLTSSLNTTGTNTGAKKFEGFVGNSAQMNAIYQQIERMAPSKEPVFITGESGTGKKICAQAIHSKSPRASKPFITINCSSIPYELLESEIFGVVKGAYTGVDKDQKGGVERAEGGILFLDEIGELEMGIQTKLLRLLQTGTITRFGETSTRSVNVRVICATNKNPMQLIAAKKFREDLFYRLHVLPIHLPPLRQRSADILPLAKSFLQRFSVQKNKNFTGFSLETEKLIISHEWRGNVRQLQNLIQNIVVMFDGPLVDEKMFCSAGVEFHLDSDIFADPNNFASKSQNCINIEPMWRQEQIIIETAIARYNGNISLAAAALEISPSTIYRKKQAWEQLQANSTNSNIFVA